ncbi:MAG: ABC transporter ATP-binding protein [Acidimicrobiales bacterium]
MLVIEGVHKRYGDAVVLRGVDMQVEPGQVVGLLGRNGAGKTTLLSIVAGLLRADTGTVSLDGHDAVADRQYLMARLGFVPQNLSVYPTLTVEANLRFFADLRMVPRADRNRAITRVADHLLLDQLLDRKVGQLSGGEQRRLHAAIGLLGRPRVVLLDEPTAGADAATRSHLLNAVRALAVEDGTACVYTSHYTPEIETIADRVAVLHHGKVRTWGSVESVIEAHGRTTLDLSFCRPVSAGAWGHHALDHVRIDTEHPSETLAKVLAELEADASALSSVDISRPSLESAYLALTEEPEVR